MKRRKEDSRECGYVYSRNNIPGAVDVGQVPWRNIKHLSIVSKDDGQSKDPILSMRHGSYPDVRSKPSFTVRRLQKDRQQQQSHFREPRMLEEGSTVAEWRCNPCQQLGKDDISAKVADQKSIGLPTMQIQ